MMQARFAIIAVCFLLSGATALVYQVVWLRMLGLVFGHSVYAITTVLAAFMAGLTLGSFLFARWAARLRHPVRAYGFMEIAIGAYCAAVPALFHAASLVYLGLSRALDLSYGAFSLAQFLLVFIVLVVPTTLMGGTLPVLSQALVRDQSRFGRTVSALYAINTLGAVAGTALVGYVILPALGNTTTVALAAAANLAVGALALVIGRGAGGVEAPPAPDVAASAAAPPPAARPASSRGARLTLVALCVSGAVSMVYEVAWTRALALVIGSSTYAFTSMLVAVLVGIALGSALYGWLWGARPASPGVFGLLQLGVGLGGAAVVLLFERMPELFVAGIGWSDSPQAVQLLQFGVSAGSLLVATLFIGATFPCAVAVYAHGARHVGRDVGRVYAVNTVGAIAGSVLAGFALIPWMGVQGSIKLGIALNLGLAAALFAASAGWAPVLRWGGAAAAALLAAGALRLPGWDQRVLSSGPAIYAQRLLQESAGRGLGEAMRGAAAVVFYRDGLSSTVAVVKAGPNVALKVNGKTDASSGGDMPTQLLSGHVPMLVHADPRHALVIGLGSGVTAGAVARYPVQRLDVVELEAAVVEANRFFAELNGHVLRDPRVRLLVADGRNVLLTTRETYDVIISEPSNPWISGLASLFTAEFFQLARSRLRPGGVMLQWIQLYALPPDDLRMVVGTFRAVFPSTTVWKGTEGDLLLLGRTEPAPLDLRRLRQRFEGTPAVARDLAQIEIDRWEDILAHFVLTEGEAARYAQGSALNRDDTLPLEFSAPRALYLATVSRNWGQIRRFGAARLPEVSPESQALLDTPDVQTAVGRAHLKRRQFAEALDRFEHVIERDPRHVPALIGASRALLGLDRFAGALERAREASALDPASAEARYVVGLAMVKLYRPEEAVLWLERAVALSGRDPDYLEALVRARRNTRGGS